MPGSDEYTRAEIIVRGIVQGVSYRYFTVRNAEPLGLSGFVKNLPDGSVEVVAEGERKNILALIELLRDGPRAARVSGMSVRWLPYRGEFHRFDIKFQ